jgi:Phosphate-starvation-inducible E family
MAEQFPPLTRSRVATWLSYGEDTIYLLTGGALGVTAAVILVSAGGLFVQAVRAGALVQRSVEILDALLLVLMIVEILHTIRVSILKHSLLAEPFLVVALIAGVRRILILTVEAARFLGDQPDQFERVLAEMKLLSVFFVVIVGSIVLLRRFAPTGTSDLP